MTVIAGAGIAGILMWQAIALIALVVVTVGIAAVLLATKDRHPK